MRKRSIILDSNDTAVNSSETELFIPSQEVSRLFTKSSLRLLTLSLLQDYSLYFTHAQELLDIFTDMEEKSLPLVQKSQQTSETLDQLQTKIEAVHIDQLQQVEHLQEKVDQLEQTIRDALQRERSCRTVLMWDASRWDTADYIDRFREHRNEKNETFIEQMVEAVGNLYRRHILSADAGVSTRHMIEALENRMKSLLFALEHADSRRLVEAEKVWRSTDSRGKIATRSNISVTQHCRSNCRAAREGTTRKTKQSAETPKSLTSRYGTTLCESLFQDKHTSGIYFGKFSWVEE